MERNMAEEHSIGQMALNTRENSMITTFMEEVYTNGLMEDNMMENGVQTRCTETEPSFGKMVELTRVSTRMIRKKVMEPSPGLMEENTLEIGI